MSNMSECGLICMLHVCVLLILHCIDVVRYSTPLHDAVCCGRQQIVKILLEAGAHVNELDYKNATPLKLAIRYGQEEIEAMLRARGAKETMDIPKKMKDGEDHPPWVRKASRRES